MCAFAAATPAEDATAAPSVISSDVYTRISALPLSALRWALEDARISVSDCDDVAELRDRLVAAIAAGYVFNAVPGASADVDVPQPDAMP